MIELVKSIFSSFGKVGAIAIVALLVIALVVCVPLLFIWGVNLMGVPVDYTIWTWLGAFIVMGVLRGGSSK